MDSDHLDEAEAIDLSPEDAASLDDAVRFVADQATTHLQQARSLQGSLPKPGRLALLPVIPAMVYLNRLQAADYNILDPRVGHDPTRLKLLLLLARTWMTGVL
jgi:phytoene/squalene synthetase